MAAGFMFVEKKHQGGIPMRKERNHLARMGGLFNNSPEYMPSPSFFMPNTRPKWIPDSGDGWNARRSSAFGNDPNYHQRHPGTFDGPP